MPKRGNFGLTRAQAAWLSIDLLICPAFKHLQACLDAFAFRFNRRKSRDVRMLFFRLAQHGAGAQTPPVSYRALDQASAPSQQVGVT